LQTTGGSLSEIRVPMLECKVCGGAAQIEFAALRKHQQLWLDMDAEVLFAYGTEEGLRHIGDRVGRALGWPVSPSSIQRRVHQLQVAVEAWRQEVIDDPPDVLMIDGLWFTAVLPTEGRFTDRMGRDRPQVAKVKRVALVVLGLWSKTGRQQVLDFEIAEGEDEATVVALLNRLHERGVTEAHVKLISSDGAEGIMAAIETVYPTVARQRCIVHKLDNVWGHVREKAHRPQLMHAAASIYEAADADEARARLKSLVAEWLSSETEAVACLVTDFEASIAYFQAPELTTPRRFRTINPLEGGIMRPLRRKLDHATAFHSHTGADVALFLCLQRLNARQRRRPWSHAAEGLLETCLNLYP
jgi:transposase-like protein